EALPEAPKLNQMAGLGFQLIPVRCILVVPPALEGDIAPGIEYVVDQDAILASRYDVREGACYLIRPDQHIAARWRTLDVYAIKAALYRATSTQQEVPQCHS